MTDSDPRSVTSSVPAVQGARAIVLVPGFQRAERFACRDALVRGLCAQERPRLQAGPESSVGGESFVSLLSRDGVPGPPLHVFEAYWADMLADTTPPTPWARLLQGFGLVAYWMNVRMLRALRVSRFLTFGLCGGGLVLILWYLGTIMLAAKAIGSAAEGWPDWLRDIVVPLGNEIGGWKLWATVTLLLPLLRADEVARLAGFSRRYLQNRASETELGLRDRVRQRVQATLDHVEAAGYGEVLVVAHSFGTIVASDIFADRSSAPVGPRLRLVTWGSPAAVMQHRSTWLRTEIGRLLASTSLARWVDVYSDTDWLCAAFPGRKRAHMPGESRRVDFDAPFLDRVLGRTHLAYYAQPEALAPLLEA